MCRIEIEGDVGALELRNGLYIGESLDGYI